MINNGEMTYENRIPDIPEWLNEMTMKIWKNQLSNRLIGKLNGLCKDFDELPEYLQEMVHEILENKYINNKDVFLTDEYFALPSAKRKILDDILESYADLAPGADGDGLAD